MNGVSRLYLQAYHEYCWRLANRNRDGWLIYSALIKAIKDQYEMFQNANDVLDQTIHQESKIINQSVDDNLNFGDYPN